MTKKLHISDSLALPLDFVTSTQVILAQKGKGKSYTASVQAEELLDAGQQVVVIDPTGAWFGLRSSPDGKSSGYSIAVLGGEHADVPIEPTAGEVIADAIATEHFSAIVDLTLFRKGEALRFMAAFLETLYRRNRSPLHLFVDEADVVAPQKTFSPEQARTLGAAEDIVRRGRIRGIGCTLITQRPQVLNKDVLTQADMLTTLGMNHPKDLGAIGDWVAVHGDPAKAKEMIASLPSLPKGDAWIWNPAADIFKRVTIRKRRTFDSGKTPKSGERPVEAKVLAPVDIARLGATIAASVEQAKANDPKALRARVAELEKQIAAKGKPMQKIVEHVVEKPIANKAMVTALERSIERAGEMMQRATELMAASAMRFEAEVTKLRSTIAAATSAIAAPKSPGDRSARTGVISTAKAALRTPGGRPTLAHQDSAQRSTSNGSSLPVGEASTLRALIQYTSGLRREQLTVLTGYKRSTRDAYIQRLRERGMVDIQGDRVVVTRDGVHAMPNADPLPTGHALQDYWMQKLPIGEGLILAALLELNGDDTPRDLLTEKTGYKRSTRGAYLQRLAAKELVVDVGRGLVKASPTLFEVAP